MADTLELVGLGLSAVATLTYLVVAGFLSRRKVSERARGAQRGFVIWWTGLGALGIFGLVFNDVYGRDLTDYRLGTYMVVLYVLLVTIYVMLGGLVYYLLYLYTGSRRSLWYTAVFYVLVLAFTAWLVHGFGGLCFVPDDAGCVAPDGWEAGDGRTVGSMEERPTWTGGVFGLLLVVPPLVAAIMYFALFFRVDDPTSRYRVLVISGGIIMWFLFSLFNTALGIVQPDAGAARQEVARLVSQSLGLVAALLVLVAYFPPKVLQRKYGLSTLGDQL